MLNPNFLSRGYLRLWSKYQLSQLQTHPLTYLFWECTLNCNFSCKHCGSNAGAGSKPDKNELTTTEIKKVFQEIAIDFDPRKIMLAVTGGEPLVRKDLFEVMSYAASLGFSWGMVSNGYLMDQKIVEKAKKAQMKTVVISIDGLAKTHDWFRGKNGAYEKAIKAVKLLSQANFLRNLQITTTVHRKNIFELDAMYTEFLTLGINSWRVFNIDPIGRAENNPDLLLTSKDIQTLLNFIKIKSKLSKKAEITYGCGSFLGMNYEKQVRDHYFNCPTGINIASILANGDIFVCPNVPRQPDLIQGNVRQDRFSAVWNNKFKEFRDPNRTSCSSCQKCEYWLDCRGGSFHLWNFKKRQPKMCIYKIISS